MSRTIFELVCTTLKIKYDYLKQSKNAAGLLGFKAHQKCTAALRLIGYGVCGDFVDEDLRLTNGRVHSCRCVEQFAQGVVECFSDEYIRPSNMEETKILLQRGEMLAYGACLDSLIVVSGTGRIALPHVSDNTTVRRRSQR